MVRDPSPPCDRGGAYRPLKVADAWQDYLQWFGQHRKSLKDMQLSGEALILPALGAIDVTELTTASSANGMRSWQRLAAD